MKQQSFESQHQHMWADVERLLDDDQRSESESFPRHYRQVCQHLAVAKHRRYSPHLIDRLNRLVLRSHHHLYGHRPRMGRRWIEFIARDFPVTLRANAIYVWLSSAFFVLPLMAMFVLCYTTDETIYSVMSPENVRSLENMYDPEQRVLGRERTSDTDVLMFGFYIKNNIGISFQVFATGILFGIGSVFFLVFNGLVIGASAGHMAHVGFYDTFFPFVVGHGSFELIAIVFSGAAGLMIGFALIDPGQRTRMQALKMASVEAVKIIYGTTAMLLIAAFIEAFWSSSTSLPLSVKYSVGALLWVMVIAYCSLAGRGRDGS